MKRSADGLTGRSWARNSGAWMDGGRYRLVGDNRVRFLRGLCNSNEYYYNIIRIKISSSTSGKEFVEPGLKWGSPQKPGAVTRCNRENCFPQWARQLATRIGHLRPARFLGRRWRGDAKFHGPRGEALGSKSWKFPPPPIKPLKSLRKAQRKLYKKVIKYRIQIGEIRKNSYS